MHANVCLPLALGGPIAKEPAHKFALLSVVEKIHENLDPPFNINDFHEHERRVERQMIMVSSNYYFAFIMLCLMQDSEHCVLESV